MSSWINLARNRQRRRHQEVESIFLHNATVTWCRISPLPLPKGSWKEDEILETELHTFTDASEKACAAVCYIRHGYADGSVIVRLVKAATKLAPVKTVSLCKLELTAALLGARLACFVGESLTRLLPRRFFGLTAAPSGIGYGQCQPNIKSMWAIWSGKSRPWQKQMSGGLCREN